MIEKSFTSTKDKNSARKNKNYLSLLSCCECISLHIAYYTSVSETKHEQMAYLCYLIHEASLNTLM